MAGPERVMEPAGAGLHLGPAAVVAAAAAVPLVYLPGLDSVFTQPKLALLMIAGALGLGGHVLALAGGAPRVRWPAALAAALAALLVTTEASAMAAIFRELRELRDLRTATAPGSPAVGAPYAPAELMRWIAVIGVALGAAQAAGDAGWRRRLFRSIHASAGVVSLIGLVQHLQLLPAALAIPTISVPGSTFGNRNMAAEAVAMAIPFGLGLVLLEGRGRKAALGAAALERARASPLLFAVLALETVYLAVTRTRGAWLGGALGAAAFFALQRPALRPAARRALGALALGAIAAAVVPGRFTQHDSLDVKRYQTGPRVVLDAIDPTAPAARTRLGLWRRTLEMYRQHPILGVGPGSFPVLFPRYAEPGADEDGVLTPSVVPRRAHNDLIERLAETGALGLAALLAVYAAAAALALRATRRARREAHEAAGAAQDEGRKAAPVDGLAADRDGRRDGAADGIAAASAAGAIAALIASGLTGFPLAMPATALLFGVAVGVLGAAAGRVTAATAGRRPLAWAGAAVFVAVVTAGAGAMAARGVLASRWLGQADATLRDRRAGDGAARALGLLARAGRADPSSFRVALLTAHAAQRAGSADDAHRAALRALALEPYSPHAWAACAEASLLGGDAVAAAAEARRATDLLRAYPAALSTLARGAARAGDGAAEADARARLAALAVRNEDARRLLAALGPGAAAP